MKQLLPHVRPSVAYQLARMSCNDPIRILAERTYPSSAIKIEGVLVRETVQRYAVYCRFMDGHTVAFFTIADLNMLPGKVKEARDSPMSKLPVAFYVMVDLFDIADQLQLKQIKPYFVRSGSYGPRR
jgi:hypothetical protein